MEPLEGDAADDSRKYRLDLDTTIWVAEVREPGEELQHLVTLFPPKDMYTKEIIPEAIVGTLRSLPKEGEAIEPEDFVRNKVFDDFMHEFIALHGPALKGLQSEARRQGEGWVYIIDARTATPHGKVQPQDIIGAFEVKAGQLAAQLYKRNPKHVLLSQDGFFRLPPELHGELVKELTARNSRPKEEDNRAQGK